MATSKGGYVSGGFDILKAPNAPTITSVTTGIGSASVAFTAPTDVGGGAITSYTITAVNESTGASTGAVGSASPITISPGGGTFKIRAAATNIYGPGRVSQYDTGNQIYAGAELWAFGYNNKGQLGNTTVVSRSSPIQVGSLTTWAQVSAGSYNSAAVKTDGTIWTWGYNNAGQLGDQTVVNKSSPIQVGALTDWAQVSAGDNQVSSTKTNGTLWAWGINSAGKLGDGTTVNKSSPVQIGSLTNWSRVSAGSAHCAATKTDGTLWAWGANGNGQLGQGNLISRSSPVQIGALTDWAQVSAGASAQLHTVAVKTNNTLWAWGANGNGQLGDGTALSRSSPVQIGALTNWAQVAAGNRFTAAVKTDGTMWAWGYDNQGNLGQGSLASKSSPVQVGALTNWAQVSAGFFYSVAAVKTDGTLWAWGGNLHGKLGDGTTANKSSPVQIGALTSWYQAEAGTQHTLALYGVT